jgi:hypothetical protein
MIDPYVVTRGSLADAPPTTSRTTAALDTPVTIGRRGEIPLGVDIPDEGISRVAVTVTATSLGWTITDTSRNGVIVSPWGLAPLRPTATLQLRWPLVAIRVLGTRADARHEVLLECAAYADPDPTPAPGPTAGAPPPRPLTPAESAALAVVFEPNLAWPPDPAGEPLQLKQAARRLGVSASAVKVRLEGARTKAEGLGLERRVGVTDPAYLHVLVAAGYVSLPHR